MSLAKTCLNQRRCEVFRWLQRFDRHHLPDGIIDVNADNNDNITVYDLSGRKSAVLHKGINIVNGKKVLIR